MTDTTAATVNRQGRGGRLLSKASRVLLPGAVLATLIIIWQLLIEAYHVKPFVMPKPTAIWASFMSQPGILFQYGLNTTHEAIEGLVISFVLGVCVAAATFKVSMLRSLARTYSAALISLPVVAVVPLANVFFGLEPASRVFVVTVATTPIIVVYTTAGLLATDPGLLESFRSCAARPRKLFFGLYLPSALPYIMSGLRVAVPTTFVVAIIAEFFGGQLNTLGTFIKSAQVQSHVADLWGAALMSFLFAAGLFALLVASESLLFSWKRRS